MALLFADTGGANYDTSTIPQFWSAIIGAPQVFPGLDGSCLTTKLGLAWAVEQSLSVALNTTSTVGFACQAASAPGTPSQGGLIMAIPSSGIPNPALYLNSLGQLSWIANAVTICASSNGAFTFGQRNYIEVQYQCNSGGTSISSTIFVNGIVVASGSATVAVAATTSVVFGDFQGLFGPSNLEVGTMYVNDSTGSFCNGPLGNTYMNLLLPDSEGRVDTWTPFGNSPNFACVNTVPPPGDATYNFTSTVNNADCYGLQAPAGNLGSITGVVSMASLRIDVAGSRSVAVGLGNGSTESYGSGVAMTTSYNTVRQNFSSNPFTSSAWLTTDIAALQGAVKVTA